MLKKNTSSVEPETSGLNQLQSFALPFKNKSSKTFFSGKNFIRIHHILLLDIGRVGESLDNNSKKCASINNWFLTFILENFNAGLDFHSNHNVPSDGYSHLQK